MFKNPIVIQTYSSSEVSDKNEAVELFKKSTDYYPQLEYIVLYNPSWGDFLIYQLT